MRVTPSPPHTDAGEQMIGANRVKNERRGRWQAGVSALKTGVGARDNMAFTRVSPPETTKGTLGQ
jgi:hypothetical protein